MDSPASKQHSAVMATAETLYCATPRRYKALVQSQRPRRCPAAGGWRRWPRLQARVRLVASAGPSPQRPLAMGASCWPAAAAPVAVVVVPPAAVPPVPGSIPGSRGAALAMIERMRIDIHVLRFTTWLFGLVA